MIDNSFSLRLGVSRIDALEHYLAANPNETKNRVIAGTGETYLKETGHWNDELPTGSQNDHPGDLRRPKLSERVARLKKAISEMANKS